MTTTFAQRTKTICASTVLLAASLGLSGCLNISSDFDGETLAELDKGGDAPTEIGLAGPDNLVLKSGEKLTIKVKGDADAIEALRFNRDGNSLTVGRDGDWSVGMGTATVTITMPPPTDISQAGSGDITAAALADDADISMAGSGSVNVTEVASSNLEITVAGSGSVTGAGSAEKLDINILGSGDVDFSDLKADDVEVTIAGSGSVKVASDGKVEASIAGSGSVDVDGSATCTATTRGSGSLTCESATTTASEDE